MSVILELSIFPMDKGVSVSPYVSRVVKIIKDSGLPYATNSMGTCIEGAWDEVHALVDRCFKELEQDCDRIYLMVKADYRKDRIDGMRKKVESVHDE